MFAVNLLQPLFGHPRPNLWPTSRFKSIIYFICALCLQSRENLGLFRIELKNRESFTFLCFQAVGFFYTMRHVNPFLFWKTALIWNVTHWAEFHCKSLSNLAISSLGLLALYIIQPRLAVDLDEKQIGWSMPNDSTPLESSFSCKTTFKSGIFHLSFPWTP